MRSTTTTAAAATALALVLSGCGLGERALEAGLEQVSGGDINIDDDGVSFESDEGSFSADSEGGINIETEDGTFTSGADLPDDFPASVPLPDAPMLNASRIDDGGTLGWVVQFQYESGTPSDALEQHIDELTAAGFAPPEDGEGSFMMGSGEDGSGMGGQILEDDSYTVIVSTVGEPGDFFLGLQVFENDSE